MNLLKATLVIIIFSTFLSCQSKEDKTIELKTMKVNAETHAIELGLLELKIKKDSGADQTKIKQAIEQNKKLQDSIKNEIQKLND